MKSFFKRLYRTLSSTTFALLVLAILALLTIVGTIVPQGMSEEVYLRAWGKPLYERLRTLGLLDAYHSWWFITIGLLFFLNLLLCTLNRIIRLFRPKSQISLTPSTLKAMPIQTETLVERDLPTTRQKLLNILIGKGFKSREVVSDEGVSIRTQKGISSETISIVYHIGMVFAFIGFFLSYFFAYSGDVSVKKGEKVKIPSVFPKTKWSKIFKSDTTKIPEGYELRLDEFNTEYNWHKNITYKKTVAGKFGLLKKVELAKEPTYFAKDWKSIVSIYERGQLIKTAKIEVNYPLFYKGLTVYQVKFPQEIRLKISPPETVITVRPQEPFPVPQVQLPSLRTDTSEKYIIGIVNLGILYRKGEKPESIIPNANFYIRSEDGQQKKLGRIYLNQPFDHNGKKFILEDIIESSGLSYRSDPGIIYLWIFVILFMLFMGLRIYLTFYQLQILLIPEEKWVRVLIGGKSTGLLENLLTKIKGIEEELKTSTS